MSGKEITKNLDRLDRIHRSFREDPDNNELTVQAVIIAGDETNGSSSSIVDSGWVIDSDGLVHYYVREKDSSSDPVTYSTAYFNGPDGTVVTPNFPVAPYANDERYRRPLSKEELAIDDTAAVSLTIPDGATGARVAVETSGDIRLWLTGDTATTTSGELIRNRQVFEIGRASEDSTSGIEELVNFSAISTVGTSGKLNITYYQEL